MHNESKTVLALDLGTITGFALAIGGDVNVVVSGEWNLKGSRFEGGGMRNLRFHKYLEELNFNSPLGEVYFEEVRKHEGTDAAHIYGGFMAILTKFCEEKEIPYAGVPVGTIKSHATGKGNANKGMMIDAMQARGHDLADGKDNEADALALLYFALETLCVQPQRVSA